MARAAAGALLAATAWGCVPPGSMATPAPSRANVASGVGGLRDERVLVGSALTIHAVAVSRRYVYAAATEGTTPGGLAPGSILLYDRLRAQWLPPLGLVDGVGDLPITALAADPVDDALWIGQPGRLRVYRPFADQWTDLPITGTPDLIAFERLGAGAPGALPTGDAWVRAAGGWLRVSRAGMAFPANGPPASGALVAPPSVGALAAQFPALRTLASTVPPARGGNRPLRPHPLVAAALAPDRAGELWVGTAGGGLLEVDGFSGRAEAHPFGLLAPGAGALAPALGGVWVGGAGYPSARAGLTYVGATLQQWRWVDGTVAVPLEGVRVHALATRGAVAWMGTERGVVRVALEGDEAMTRFTVLDGLPDNRVLAVAPRATGCWVGTPRGLAFLPDSAAGAGQRPPAAGPRALGPTWLANQPVLALQGVGDTLWIGTDQGVWALPLGTSDVPPIPVALPEGGAPAVRALAATDSLLLLATDQQLYWRVAPARQPGAPWQAVPVELRPLGRVLRVAADAHSVFVAGTQGVLQWQRRTGAMQWLAVPAQLPGPALDLVAADGWLWVGTPAGLLRLRRDATGALWP